MSCGYKWLPTTFVLFPVIVKNMTGLKAEDNRHKMPEIFSQKIWPGIFMALEPWLPTRRFLT